MKRLIMGIAIGAGAMYLLDPENGAERRGKLLGFYGENKDTLQDYAQTAAQTAVTVSHTVGDVASTVADKAGEITGKSDSSADKVGDMASNGGTADEGAKARVDELLNARSTTRKSSASTEPPPGDTAPGKGGSRSS